MTDVQQTILAIFKEVAAILDRHAIPYYAIGGTCIGAVRHGGFIPWDDDMDIAVPIEHWDRLMDALAGELPGHLYLYTGKSIRHYRYIFAKVCDRRTSFIEQIEVDYKDAYKGIFLDIMPISGIPPEPRPQRDFISRLLKIENNNIRCRYSDAAPTLKSRILRFPFRMLPWLGRRDFFSRQWLNLLKKHPFSQAKSVGYVWFPIWLPRLIFPAGVFGDGVMLPFEDTTIRVPLKYHDYLTMQFGDYMKIPDEKDREPHHGYIHTDIPYTEFQSGARPLS